MTKYGRIEDGVIVDYRELDIQEIPDHKRNLWMEVIDNPPTCEDFYEYIQGPVLRVEGNQIIYDYFVMKHSDTELKAMVKAEAERRITQVLGYTIIKQINALAERNLILDKAEEITSDDRTRLNEIDEMFKAINTIREKSNALEALDKIPKDFASSKYWE